MALIIHTAQDYDNLLAAHGPCHNRACVNPHHLSWQTHKQNMNDKIRDGTSHIDINPNYATGESHGGSKLTFNQVAQILKDGLSVDIELQSKVHGVDQRTVKQILIGERWLSEFPDDSCLGSLRSSYREYFSNQKSLT